MLRSRGARVSSSATSATGPHQGIIADPVWLYVRLNLSLREFEEIFLKPGIDVSYETIRRWVAKFAPQISRNLRRWQVPSGDVWHLDEVVVMISGRKFWLWHAVDQEGIVLEEILQFKRDKRAAKHLLKALIKRFGLPPETASQYLPVAVPQTQHAITEWKPSTPGRRPRTSDDPRPDISSRPAS